MKIDRRFLNTVRGRLEGHNLRAGILQNKTHQPAAPKTEGRETVLGGPARKTLKSRKKQLQAQLKKNREQAAKIRENLQKSRAGVRSRRETLRGAGLKGKSLTKKLSRANARIKKLSASGRSIRAASKELRAQSQKLRKSPNNFLQRISIREVLTNARKATGVNILTRPFQRAKSSAYRKFIDAYLRAATRGKSMAKVEKLLLDVIRVPVLKKQYGRNSPSTVAIKGFNRRFVDTGQMILALSAQIRRRGKRV